MERSFTIEQMPVYVKAGAIVPMQPPMRYTGEKPVDPLIVNVWPLAPGASSSYSVYEDSGVSVEYQKGVFARTPIKAAQDGDTLRVEIGPVEGQLSGNAEDARLRAAAACGLAAGFCDGEWQGLKPVKPGEHGRLEVRRQHADDDHSGAGAEHSREGCGRGAAGGGTDGAAREWMDLPAR